MAQENTHMFSLSLILLSISNNGGIKRPVKELLAMQGLFQAIVHKRGNLYFWTPILTPSPPPPPPPPTFPPITSSPSSRGAGTVLCIQQISAQWIFEMSGHLLCLCVEELNFYTARHIPEPGHMYYSSRNIYKGPAHLTLSTFCKHMY